MASLYITVFRQAHMTALGDPTQEEVVTIDGTSRQSNAISGDRAFRTVRLCADSDCFIHWGSNPTALNDGTAGRAVGADNPEYWSIAVGDKIAVIQRA